MGVPKLFRWLSERYPCLSEKVQEWQIPEFDNLYLDMNSIVHAVSHPQYDDVHFRITEEQMYKDLFNYIDFLFKTIKPKKVMFMAIDGVAPRAKMNQQRSRRFRTAREANEKEQDAIKRGEKLPETKRFDSNCITPGTTFMIKLQEQLKYFVVKKVSTDEMWKNVKVYLSGHDAPGEGEHKIMDFIRYCKSQPDYDPYTRHCLYGLDADLIMLGSVSHEPYFSLLREEVTFVKTKTTEKKPTSPEKINFYLLHLSILRDYLEIEFSEIREKHPSLFNIESIIDDWVFMCILVGNDFIPHLPHYHINKNSLVVLFKAYIEVLPIIKGYLNEQGTLNLERLEVFFEKLSELEQDQFDGNNKEFQEVFKNQKSKIKKSVKKLTGFFDENDEVFEDALEETNNNGLNLDDEGFDLNAEDDETDESTTSDEEIDGFLTATEFELSKRSYYERKLNLKNVTEEIVREHTFAYIEALQWNLYYYYNGCQSWTWYYPYHYAPYVSDIKRFKEFKIKFPKDKPLLPYEQLLGVLPIASKRFLPESYQNMMTCKDSPLADCYPIDFKLDLNGKQQAWESVVLIPFIEQQLLLKASSIAKSGLNEQEKSNNKHGPHLLYEYTEDRQPDFPSSFRILKFLEEKVWKKWCKQLLSALCYLHSSQPPIIHENLTCDTIFISHNGLIKCGAVAPNAIHQHIKTVADDSISNIYLVAPEIMNLTGDINKVLTPAVDIYSFGMCALEMAALEITNGESTQITKETVEKTIESLDNELQKDFVRKCLAENPLDRPSAKDLLFHPVIFEVPSLSLLAAHTFLNNSPSYQFSFDETFDKNFHNLSDDAIFAEIVHADGRPGVVKRISDIARREVEKFFEEVRNGAYPLTAIFPLTKQPIISRQTTISPVQGSGNGNDQKSNAQENPYNEENRKIINMMCNIKIPNSQNAQENENLMMTLLLRLDDKMNRQLSCEINDIESPICLANELVYYGFINQCDRDMVASLIGDTIKRTNYTKSDTSASVTLHQSSTTMPTTA